LRDIHAQLGTDAYWRLRLGVGHPGIKSEVVDWVLKKPSLDHRIAVDQSIERSLKALPHFLAGEMDKAMMVVHTSKPPRPKLPKPEGQAPAKTAPD
jgi:PTH1 family peptidyl-tRNA hydrolase